LTFTKQVYMGKGYANLGLKLVCQKVKLSLGQNARIRYSFGLKK